MDLLHRLQHAKSKLTKVDTIVTHPDGSQLVESRDKTGAFTKTDADPEAHNEAASAGASGNDEVSKRRQKKVARMRQMGYVVDLKPDLQMAEVTDGVFVGSQDVASDYKLLRANKITHILNVATGIQNQFPRKFYYHTIEILDEPNTQIKNIFKMTNEFILNSVSRGGRVLIHCNAGVSRSCTIAIAYIMWSQRKPLGEAMQQVKTARPSCRPNDGFMRQLKEYEEELFRNAVCKTS